MSAPAGRTVQLRTADGVAFEAYLCGDAAGEAKPGLILFGTVFGVDADLRQMADAWAARGYVVMAPDCFFRVQPGALPRDMREQAIARWQALDIDRLMQDAAVMKEALLASAACNGRFACLGLCAGGEFAFLAGTRLGAEVVVANHGNRIDQHLDEAGQLAGHACLNFGAIDDLIPLAQVARIEAALAANDKVEVHVYGGARHGFSFAGRPTYHAAAAMQSDLRAQALFATLKQGR